ncbi:MAG: dihydroorotate dehydrogenase [Peptococcaceae bacterium]|jgi:dihydroorotate dehydrogenase (NAD+) catalytic subunit|nr:dihydroorotate dehydrogenase [Peptococcaceae bacterium]MDH7526320.1 dihydroorotate dehydrogenase [Peptococcaceae bacterium]
MVNLAVDLAGVRLKNPVMTASGCFGFGREYCDFYDLSLLGAVVVKGITLQPRLGNPPPRIAETPAGLLNSVGLQNPGVDYVIREEIPWLANFGVPVIVNINGHSSEEFGELAARLDGVPGVAALEVNISCPNVKEGGMFFGTDPAMASEVVKSARKRTRLPLIVKLSPNVTDIVLIARAVEEAGADAVSLINTLLGMAIDTRTRRPALASVVGGLSGPAVKPVALRMVWQVSRAVNIPVVGMGGIVRAEDAVEFMLAGATAVAVGSGAFYDPLCAVKVIEGLERWLEKEKIADVQEIIGGLRIEEG